MFDIVVAVVDSTQRLSYHSFRIIILRVSIVFGCGDGDSHDHSRRKYFAIFLFVFFRLLSFHSSVSFYAANAATVLTTVNVFFVVVIHTRAVLYADER